MMDQEKNTNGLPTNINNKNKWEVCVDNVGVVFIGNNGFNAIKCFNECILLSRSKYGRMSGENVYLIKNDEINKEYNPKPD